MGQNLIVSKMWLNPYACLREESNRKKERMKRNEIAIQCSYPVSKRQRQFCIQNIITGHVRVPVHVSVGFGFGTLLKWLISSSSSTITQLVRLNYPQFSCLSLSTRIYEHLSLATPLRYHVSITIHQPRHVSMQCATDSFIQSVPFWNCWMCRGYVIV